ncbi:MAG: glycosyltransferase [Lentisphaerae bacterium]|jgi:rhamnosyltransferase|nr:glycosyltransferase [Lentisphaerota bacterium]
MPAFSVVIRSHNDRIFIDRTLDGLRRQTQTDFEVIFCDDNSTDGTAEVIAEWPDALRLPPEEGGYVPGKVLNRAVRAASGDIVVFNNADAIITHDEWLANLTRPFDDQAVAATFARQDPRPDAWPMVQRDHARAFGDGRVAANWRHFFSLASAAARRHLLLEQPFDERLQYSEDIEWSWRMKRLDWKISYVPDAVAEHSHNYEPAALWKRFYNEGLADAAIFDDSPNLLRAFRRWLAETARDYAFCLQQGSWKGLLSAPAYRFRQKFAHYCGLRDFAQKKAGARHG